MTIFLQTIDNAWQGSSRIASYADNLAAGSAPVYNWLTTILVLIVLLYCIYFYHQIVLAASLSLNTFFGSQYVWITNFSLVWSTCFEKQAAEMRGAQEIGTWLIYLFFFAIGVPASIGTLVRSAPILLLFCMIIVLVNMLFCFLGGKLFRFDLEEIILASNANIGGPTTAAGMAISQGWVKLIGPCMLVGTFGYVIGTWLGILVGSILGA